MKEKKIMQKPEIEVIAFDASDIIATSGTMTNAGSNTVNGYSTGLGFGGIGGGMSNGGGNTEGGFNTGGGFGGPQY